MSNNENFNGPPRELGRDDDLVEQSVYCTQCGTVFVPARGRDCPNCTVVELLEEHAFDPEGLDGDELDALATRLAGRNAGGPQ